MTPQLQIQVTPCCWRVEFLYQSVDSRPVKLGLSLGCFAVSLFLGKSSYGTGQGYDNSVSHTFVEDDA